MPRKDKPMRTKKKKSKVKLAKERRKSKKVTFQGKSKVLPNVSSIPWFAYRHQCTTENCKKQPYGLINTKMNNGIFNQKCINHGYDYFDQLYFFRRKMYSYPQVLKNIILEYYLPKEYVAKIY